MYATPCSADVQRSLSDKTVEISLEGYKTRVVQLDRVQHHLYPQYLCGWSGLYRGCYHKGHYSRMIVRAMMWRWKKEVALTMLW